MLRSFVYAVFAMLIFSNSATALTTGNPKRPRPVHNVIHEINALDAIEGQQVICVAMAVYHESRGLNDESQFAVASVVMNRAKLEGFPPRPCGVVWQPWAFSWTKKVRNRVPAELESWEKAQRIAYNTYIDPDTYDPTYGATHFHGSRISPHWAEQGYDVIAIESHVFMKVNE